ncbi:unnamed protein product [Vicia faba]|uniref:PPM-type phosphatase domain-containing protein n=1 Tax=Vicia faba TaxID=3906 RepID=A0AAV1ALY9_VICFA|nr:unnamed protein product [Vicia faba]
MVEDINIDELGADPSGRTMKLHKHPFGEFSMASVQANEKMEDFGQVEIGNNAIFVGIYDGQNGIFASQYLKENLFPALLCHMDQNDNNMSEDILRETVAAMERRFMLDADKLHDREPQRAVTSSSCLFCIIWNGKLYVANVGGSRAVMGSSGLFDTLRVQQLVRDHNAGNKHVQDELARLHPDDPDIVMYHNEAWSVAGVSEVSRCIGNAYLKRARFTLVPSFEVSRTELASSDFTRPLLSAEPEIYSRVLRDNDKFIIFGSGGLWKFLTNEEAAKIVNTNPRKGIAKRLIRIAQEIAARRKNITYSELSAVPRGGRCGYHDDIVVTVVFLDKKPDVITSVPRINSSQSFFEAALRSNFHYVYAGGNSALCPGLEYYA